MPFDTIDVRTDTFLDEVLDGLSRGQKRLPCKYFYDETGSRLFDRICTLEEYYPTRTELAIMRRYGTRIATALGPRCTIVELGSGSSLKTRILLDHLEQPAAYVPVDISREHLQRSAEALARAYPGLEVLPVCADFTSEFEPPSPRQQARRRIVYFPGSTIGNFHPPDARTLLRRIARLADPDGGLLIGVDLKKDPAVLERAYNDRLGVTAAFNRNLLAHINRELDGNFRLECFRHLAFYNREQGRIEMHLVSRMDQTIRVGGHVVRFKAGESIHTECSYKYTLGEFAALACSAGLAVQQVWTDPRNLFSVQYLACHQRPCVPAAD